MQIPQLILVGFPFDGNSSYMRGAAQAPPAIREAFRCESSNLWSENGVDLGMESLLFDAGDIQQISAQNFFPAIESAISDLLGRELPIVSLGGDHSITFPIISAMNKNYPALDLLHFDAHPDLYPEFQSNPYSHASPFARILENGLVKRLVQVGIRTMSGPQKKLVEQYGVEVVEMKNWRPDQMFVFDRPLYISVDMDALDPAYAPGVSHPEPGGLSTRDLVTVIQKVQAPRIVGADIVEYNPHRDPLGITAMAAAKILKELAGRIAKS
jgi:arginase